MSVLLAGVAGALGAVAIAEALGALSGRPPIRLPGAGVARSALAPARRLAGHVPEGLARQIEAARLPRSIDPGSVMGVKFLLAGSACAAAFAVASLGGAATAILVLLVVPALAFVLPDLALRRMAHRNSARVAAEVPDVAARLHMAVTAGLAPVAAMEAASRSGRGVLSTELGAAAAAALVGLPLTGALQRLVGRCPDADVRALAAALRRSQEQGSDIAGLLEEIAAGSRRRESLRVRDRAQRAGPKIQLAVALLLVPAAMCLIAAALLSGLFSA